MAFVDLDKLEYSTDDFEENRKNIENLPITTTEYRLL